MFSRHSPRKRKHSEYHDPDYPKQHPTCDDEPVSSNLFSTKRQKIQGCLDDGNNEQGNECLQKVQGIVEREFNREMAFKQKQLKTIDERISEARNLLDSLRYALVSSYYKKQELPLAAVTALAVRGAQTIFTREDKGPQMQIHPSLKKLIGKKPKDLSDVIRSCPKRTAAQNAVQTIRAKSEVQKREERKLKQIIRGQGIVIDHSLQQEERSDVTSLLNAANRCTASKSISQINTNSEKPAVKKLQGKPLISARLNNKVKHLIVVGNTSKYIGAEQERDPINKSQILTHKWLVYVQAKESTVPIERYVRKIRFYLHHSYRPNDVVNIQHPPFHVARRGWGEFPIRVQLYFHPEYRQKPVQLLHTVVLDKTLSGIQTLGAETLLEVWLRNATSNETNTSDTMPLEEIDSTIKTKQHRKFPSEELVDDNLLEFLNKIEATQTSISADIETIQPTFVVSEPLAVNSPKKTDNPSKIISKSPIKKLDNLPRDVPAPTHVTNPEVVLQKDIKNDSLVSKAHATYVSLPDVSTPVKFPDARTNAITNELSLKTIATTNSNHTTTLSKTSILLNKDGKIIMPLSSVASVVRKTILPVVTNAPINVASVQSTSVSSSYISKKDTVPTNNPPKQILQKKLVQLVDATGKVKYMQMLVAATSTAPPSKSHESSPSMAPKVITISSNCGVRSSSVTTTTQANNTAPIPIQKLSNGVNFITAAGGLTMKPNIFKIVPESMQTKPKIVTFSTIATPSITTVTSASQIQFVNKTTTTIASKQNNSPPKMIQKSNGSTTKNVVIHKEGKVYIIDPLQMKLKQQQKKQVSLLKPQVSLLKQQMQQQQQQQQETLAATNTTKIILDHNYLSPPNMTIQNNAPQVHFGLKQQRLNSINTLQLSQMKRILFEKQILRQQFTSMQCAVEFILRRLKLIAPKDSVVSAFPFVAHTDREFQSLTAFKQRTFEWLRAKHISRLLRHHKDLQNINNTTRETFWSTKEIASFARQYVYTPNIKSLPRLMGKREEDCNDFKELVKGELKQKENTPNDTLTDSHTIRKWIDKVWPVLVDYQYYEDQNQIIDVDNVGVDAHEDRRKQHSHLKTLTNSSSKDLYLSPPAYLENECTLVSGICKDLSVKLMPEELATNVWHPSTQTILAHSLNIFLQKIIRNVMSLKHQEINCTKESIHIIQPSDIAKVLSHSMEFDFLTNNNFGSDSRADSSLISSVKLEKS